MSDTSERTGYAIVVPTIGRGSLERLIATLRDQALPDPTHRPRVMVLVDDRSGEPPALTAPFSDLGWPVRVVRGFGRGPAAARNRGWRVARRSGAEWIAFLDDDVELPSGWMTALAADLAACGPRAGATQGRITVPLPPGRRPTDWERNTAALEGAAWATADMAYRVAALEATGGFDERFPRAYREDADLALRVRRRGFSLERGRRTVVHPVRPAPALQSLKVQAGNADDALMARLHGPGWRDAAEVPRGAFRRHIATVTMLCASTGAAVASSLVRSSRAAKAIRMVSTIGGAAWAASTLSFLFRRTRPGPSPRDDVFAAELGRMTVTSVAIPVAATAHRLAGIMRWRDARPWPPTVKAVLFDRDGTLVLDVPYNGDPSLVTPMDDARRAVRAVREAGLRTAVVSNQSGIARGLITAEQVAAVNARVDELLGPFDSWQVCPHGPEDGCACRKPQPGMVRAAAAALGVEPAECVVIGDIGADVDAAQRAGARAILVPTAITRPEEVAAAPEVCGSLSAAVDLALGQR
ncbi:HAD-IIIA family hydrolase [Cumulibacter manganitolerans]|uniref:HAD-IIIA family hydrolase n=1 Tax=Cumulibacter manganitolerans TaxID=1884992 RepID=UPI00129627E7|nr:HAD-IIIA family hydrolase [Cumulibacter manganitolerans]